MPLFRYEALSEKGRALRGTIDADSLSDAKQKLVRRQILVTEVVPFREKGPKRSCSKSELVILTKELSRLLKAGLPLFESLTALEEKYRTHRAHELLLDLSDVLRTGKPLSEALLRHPESFDLLYRSMIANAEQSGQLAKTLDELAQLMDKQLKIRQQMVSAFLYPALLGSFCLLVLGILLFFVVPSLSDLFEGRSLHPMTCFVFACSRLAIQGKWYLISLGIAAVAAGLWAMNSFFMREAFRKLFVRLPIIRELLKKVALARWLRSSAALLEGGIPALAALRESKTLLRHPVLEQSLQEALNSLAEGASLQEALQDRPSIPPLVPRMLGIAQASGNLASMMHQIASIYEEELDKAFSRFASFAQPILLLILGAMVGFVLLSVLLPLTDVSSFST